MGVGVGGVCGVMCGCVCVCGWVGVWGCKPKHACVSPGHEHACKS